MMPAAGESMARGSISWRTLLLWALVLASTGVGGLYRSSPVVKTRYGSLRGLIMTPNFGALQPVAVYLGVPYAAPPIRKLRFMPPMSPLEWTGVRKAETLPPVCPQKLPDVTNKRDALRKMPEGRFNYLQRLLPLLRNQSEDCLYLNIYAPATDELFNRRPERHPVLVYIHGESYEWNSGNPYDGSVLAAYGKVVVVTVNFRLGILGFLRPSMKKDQVSNFGLLDQIAALLWVKENIASFGGDPEKVTIVGHGTGAALANLLLISPVAQGGLFQRAILMSGSALSRWSVTWDPFKYTIQVAKALDCDLMDTGDALVDCLREKAVEELINVNLNVPPFSTPLGPIVDGTIVINDPAETMAADKSMFGKYDLLYGVALAESYHMLSAREVKDGMTQERRDKLVKAYVMNNFKHHSSQVFPTVVNQYQPWTSGPLMDAHRLRDQTLEIFSDAQITAPVVQMAKLHSNLNPRSFFYCFSHQSLFGDYRVRQGTVHGEELAYVFGAPLVGGFNHFPLNYTLEEKFLSELVMRLWANFAETGNPNIPAPQRFLTPGVDYNWEENLRTLWPQYDMLSQEYLNIDMKVVVQRNYRARALAVWNHLIPDLVSATSVPDGPPVPPPYVTQAPIALVPTFKAPRIYFPEYTNPTQKGQPPMKVKTTQMPQFYPIPPAIPEAPQHPPYPSGPPPPPVYAGTPISIVILVGIVILFINCCAMGAVYYQRDKFKFESKFLRRFRRRNVEEDEECVSEAPSLNASGKEERKHKRSRSDYEASDSVQSDSVSRASAVSKESSSKKRLHSQSSRDTSPPSSSKHPETPKTSHKNSSSKSSKSGHRRHKSEVSIYSEIGRTAEIHVHADSSGSRSVSRSSSKRSPTVKFNTVGSGLPPKSVTKSTTSISSKASVTSRASVKSTSSRASIKSTSEKRLKKNASCQSLPTDEYSWGITKEMTMTERDDPEGRHHTVAAMQKLNCPKVLPDHPDGMHAATLPKMRPPPPPRSTSLTAKDIQELEDKVHIVYRTKKRTPRRDASTDSCDLSGIDIYGVGGEAPSPSAFGTPAVTATINRSRSRKSDGSGDYGQTSTPPDYHQKASANSEYGRQGGTIDYVKSVGKPPEYTAKGSNDPYSRYEAYEPTYIYKDSRVAPAKLESPPQKNNSNKTYESFNESRSGRGPLATFGKMGNHSPADGASYNERSRPHHHYDSGKSAKHVPDATAIVTAAAQTALATATAPAFVGASNPGRSTSRNMAPVPAATHTCALVKQSSTTSGSDTGTVYEQSENTGTIKRKKSTKEENSKSSSASVQTPVLAPTEKPLKGVLKQTSAYDKPKPMMAKAPGASPSASALNISSTDVGTSIGVEAGHDVTHKSSSLKRINRVATPGTTRRKAKSENQTSTDVQTEPAK